MDKLSVQEQNWMKKASFERVKRDQLFDVSVVHEARSSLGDEVEPALKEKSNFDSREKNWRLELALRKRDLELREWQLKERIRIRQERAQAERVRLQVERDRFNEEFNLRQIKF